MAAWLLSISDWRTAQLTGMVSSLGMALGPAIGGWIFDTYRSYTALYLGSLAIGLVAVASAIALPRIAPRDMLSRSR